MKDYTESDLRKFISKYEDHSLLEVKNALVELKRRGGAIGSGFLENIANHFSLDNSEKLFEVQIVDYIVETPSKVLLTPEEQFSNDVIMIINKYKEGFGYILFSFVSNLGLTILFFLIVSGKSSLENMKDVYVIFSFIYFVFTLIGIIGLRTLYNASSLKKTTGN